MTRRLYFIASLFVAFLLGTYSGSQRADRALAEEGPGLHSQLFELRTYTTHPGKLDSLHKRFRDHTNHLFVKHGMKLIGYWTPAEGDSAENTLIYIVAHENRASATGSWEDFKDDPVWKKAYEESHKEGPIVSKVESVYMTPTDYSPIR